MSGQLPDICRNYHGENYNSERANEFIQPKKQSIRDLIFNYIESRGKQGATCQEAERDLNLKHQTASARFSELSKEHRIYWNGIKRALPGSQPANCYVTSGGQLAFWERA